MHPSRPQNYEYQFNFNLYQDGTIQVGAAPLPQHDGLSCHCPPLSAHWAPTECAPTPQSRENSTEFGLGA